MHRPSALTGCEAPEDPAVIWQAGDGGMTAVVMHMEWHGSASIRHTAISALLRVQ